MIIYLKNPLTDNIVKFENEDQIGVGFANWKTLTQDEANNYELSQAKLDKIAKLNTNRAEYCLEPILYNGNYYATTSNAQIAMLSYILTLDNNETLYPNSEGDNILLNKQDFLEIVSQIQEKEMSSRDLRKSNIDKMNKIELSEEAMEALNNISITF